MIKLFGICFFLCTCSLNNYNEDGTKEINVDCTNDSDLPLEIEEFLKNNSDQWARVELGEFSDELVSYLSDFNKESDNDEICPSFVIGDFTHDGKQDFAIVLKNKKYKIKEYGDYMFPFLIVFNDFKENSKPHVVYKTGKYKNDFVKTVIFSDEDIGILSYLRNGKICDTDVIDIHYFEKSSFFVYWDKESKTYQFLNYLDDSLCENVLNENNQPLSLEGTWSNNCEFELTNFNVNESNEVFLSLASDNAIYINCILELDPQENNTYNLFFYNVDSQEYYYEDKKNIIETEISKKESIATIRVLDTEEIEINWKGLFNLKTGEVDFTDNFLFLKEKNDTNPIVLKKCD